MCAPSASACSSHICLTKGSNFWCWHTLRKGFLIDQVCQISLHWHQLLKFCAKRTHVYPLCQCSPQMPLLMSTFQPPPPPQKKKNCVSIVWYMYMIDSPNYNELFVSKAHCVEKKNNGINEHLCRTFLQESKMESRNIYLEHFSREENDSSHSPITWYIGGLLLKVVNLVLIVTLWWNSDTLNSALRFFIVWDEENLLNWRCLPNQTSFTSKCT